MHTLYTRIHTLYTYIHTIYTLIHTLYTQIYTLYARIYTIYTYAHYIHKYKHIGVALGGGACSILLMVIVTYMSKWLFPCTPSIQGGSIQEPLINGDYLLGGEGRMKDPVNNT